MKKKTPRDINQLASFITKAATESKKPAPKEKNPAAVALGRLGGLKGGKARAKTLTKAQRQSIARKAAETRWKKQSSQA